MSPAGLLAESVILPALTSAVISLAVRRAAGGTADRASVAAAVGAGALAGQLVAVRPGYPPVDVIERVPCLTAAAALAGLLLSMVRGPTWLKWAACLTLSIMVPVATLGPVLNAPGSWTIAAVAGALMLASWANLDALAGRRGEASLGAWTVVAVASAGVALAASGSLVLGRLMLPVAAALGAAVGLARRPDVPSVLRRAVPLLVTGSAALLLEGCVYSDLPAGSAIALAAVPFAAWFGGVRTGRAVLRRSLAAIGHVVSAALVGLAVALAARSSPGPWG